MNNEQAFATFDEIATLMAKGSVQESDVALPQTYLDALRLRAAFFRKPKTDQARRMKQLRAMFEEILRAGARKVRGLKRSYKRGHEKTTNKKELKRVDKLHKMLAQVGFLPVFRTVWMSKIMKEYQNKV